MEKEFLVKVKRGRKPVPAVSEVNKEYCIKYLKRKYYDCDWVREFPNGGNNISAQSINNIVLSNLDTKGVAQLKTAIRKNKQYERGSGSSDYSSVPLSANAYRIIERLQGYNEFSMSDTIERFLKPYVELQRSDREELLKNLQNYQPHSF
ncbi:MAG: hypothetical protein ACJAS1_000521 [Oleiphilaceae bacterium]|jgi:hypothetical protein